MNVSKEDRNRFLEIARQQISNYKILFSSLAKAIVGKYQIKDIDKDFIDFILNLLTEAVPDKERYFINDSKILEDSMMYKRSGEASFDNRYEFIDLLLIYAREIDGIEYFNKDITRFYNYCVKNNLDFKDDEFIGICAYLNTHPNYAENKLLEIESAQRELKSHFGV